MGEYHKKYYEENKERLKKSNAIWQKENKEYLKMYRRAYYETNIERFKKYNDEFREKNKDYNKNWWKNNPEKSKEYYVRNVLKELKNDKQD